MPRKPEHRAIHGKVFLSNFKSSCIRAETLWLTLQRYVPCVADRTGFVFQTHSGKTMNQRNLAREFYAVLKTLEISRCGFRAFRLFHKTFSP
jgi:hypothetical protein